MCYITILDTVTFDNSYSLLRSKKLHYSVYVTQSVTKIAENLNLEDNLEIEETVQNDHNGNANTDMATSLDCKKESVTS